MEEVKFRIGAINHTLQGNTGLLSPFANEFGFLQLRILCELVALGCLVAHGDIKETKKLKLQKAWGADDILKMLEALHSDFYPVPVFELPIGSDGVRNFDERKDSFLSKADLLQLYAKCGNVLHRGSLKKLISKTPPIQIHFPEISGWTQKIVNLLSHHRILLATETEVIMCVLGDLNRRGIVSSAFGRVTERRK